MRKMLRVVAVAFALCGGVAESRAEAGVFALTGDGVALTLDGKGFGTSLKLTGTGRELVARRLAFAAFMDQEKKNIVEPTALRSAGPEAFVLSFPEPYGEVAFSVKPFAGGWIFEITSAAAKDFERFEFCRFQPTCTKWKGDFASAWSDEDAAVCIRSCELGGTTRGAA